jgi:glutamate transport system ATP-binding protein
MSDAGTNEEGNLVELRSVRKSFGENVVLDGIDLAIGRGEVVVIAGPSGSGKSTMLRCINGLETVDEGEVRFDGRSVSGAGKAVSRLRAEIGMVFQQFNLFAHKTVMENVTLAPMEVKGLSKADARARGQRLLERVGISEKADAYPADLSGGQQQRVAIARALAMEPEVMLFDEVTSALDPELVKGVLNLMAALGKRGMTMVVVTHEMNFARKVADQVVFMDEGEVVEAGRPDELFDRPRSRRLQRFLSEVL